MPGMKAVELLDFVGDLLITYSERLADESYLGSGPGLHRATVVDDADPLGQSRLLVRVPDVSGDQAVWAAACLPPSGATDLPATGTEVWVALESCEASRPIWLGQRVTA
jgi:Type VI secretion system/phage-baseplate injector OB domain